MTISNEKIVACPYCGAEKELMSLNSSNTIRAQYWSDIKVIAPMGPKISPVQKCPECGKYYLEYKQSSRSGEKESFRTGALSYLEWKEAYQQFCEEDSLSPEDMLNVRGWLVQSYNDYFYRGQEEKSPSDDDRRFIVEILNILIDTIHWGDLLNPLFPGGAFMCDDPAQEKLVWSSEINPILKAELYREAGEFEKCAETIRSLTGKEMNGFDACLFYCIKEWMEKADAKVFKFYDDKEESQLEISERSQEERWNKCPNGHYYRGDGLCPYCGSFVVNKEFGRNTIDYRVKICSNHHAYHPELNTCPICDSSIVIDEYDYGNDTIEFRPIHLSRAIVVKKNEKVFDGISCIYVHISRGYKLGYYFSTGNDYGRDDTSIYPDDTIQIGESSMTGRELMKFCDLILDNQLSFMMSSQKRPGCY